MERSKSCPYFDLIERFNRPRVCIDNETCDDCTLVKVDSANKHGILLEMVELLTDLDLVISRSYISSDGVWFMDVFHVTDQLGNKLTDDSLIRYIQQSLCAGKGGEAGLTMGVTTCMGRMVGSGHIAAEHAVVEFSGTDRPGLLSEVSALLSSLDLHVVSAQAWTHRSRAACVAFVVDRATGRPVTDRATLAHVEDQLRNVVGAHQPDPSWRVSVAGPAQGRAHPERRLHQLMEEAEEADEGGDALSVSVESCEEKGYSVVNVRSPDRAKLLFDTVCALTDMDYGVFHAAASSREGIAYQEYYIRRKDGCTIDTVAQRAKLTRQLVAAVERRVSQGLRLEVATKDRVGLLSDVTRVFRESGMSISRAEIATRGERALGVFYVTEASSGGEADLVAVEMVRREIGEAVVTVVPGRSWGGRGIS
ncbi:hypothetical protein QJS10_CPA02g00088 [Acorus calamus]|uniref:ACT domain-containing protein ACR n=1 Tax=Acorus calamus TaxID=4465 RepID=A0AAV9FEC0_ACOCL|nr:hypothetical protein QJS10_CPA02g00088 [Acorus calamus]